MTCLDRRNESVVGLQGRYSASLRVAWDGMAVREERHVAAHRRRDEGSRRIPCSGHYDGHVAKCLRSETSSIGVTSPVSCAAASEAQQQDTVAPCRRVPVICTCTSLGHDPFPRSVCSPRRHAPLCQPAVTLPSKNDHPHQVQHGVRDIDDRMGCRRRRWRWRASRRAASGWPGCWAR